MSVATCPHGDASCPCPDDGVIACHYESADALICPNPVLGIKGLTNPHCHMEGCEWHVYGCSPDRPVDGECGLVVKLGLPPLVVGEMEMYSMTQARPGLPGWACGWLRTPLNVGNRPTSSAPNDGDLNAR